ncbi:MAG: amino acid carrier protein [candidate division Zixibacteria bacterium]|nr:amino acid carrier protein [candidate division Zixibacteria bacterium]
MLAALGIGNIAQSNTVAHSLVEAFSVSPESEGLARWIIGVAITGLVGMVIIGGIKRIGTVASYLVPFMSVLYVGSALIIILIHVEKVIPAIQLIFYHAFNPTAATGGFAGATVWFTITHGLRRGLFSNESGLGSAPMAHSAAKVAEPVREGLVAMLGPFIDTIVICTMTALVILIAGAWDKGVNGAPMTMMAFNDALPVYGRWMVVVGIMLFAYSTILSWSYYGEKGFEYMFGSSSKIFYRWFFLVFTLLGARLELEIVWKSADIANAFMAVPNLVALLGLSGVVVAYTKKYMDEKARGLHKPFK